MESKTDTPVSRRQRVVAFADSFLRSLLIISLAFLGLIMVNNRALAIGEYLMLGAVLLALTIAYLQNRPS